MMRRIFHIREKLQNRAGEENKDKRKNESRRLYESIARCNSLIEIEQEARRVLEKS